MGYMIEITESHLDKMKDYAEKTLRYAGKFMQCIDDMERHHGGSDFRQGSDGDYRNSSGNYRDSEDWEERERRMEERRGGYRRGRY